VAAVEVFCGKGQRSVAILGDAACAGNLAAVGDVLETIEDDGSVVEDVAEDAAGGGTGVVAELQGSVADGGAAGVDVVGGENQRSFAGFGQVACAVDYAAQGLLGAGGGFKVYVAVGGVEDEGVAQGAVVVAEAEGGSGGHVDGSDAEGGVVAGNDFADTDGGAAFVGVGAGEGQVAVTFLGQAAGAGEFAAEGGIHGGFDGARCVAECPGFAVGGTGQLQGAEVDGVGSGADFIVVIDAEGAAGFEEALFDGADGGAAVVSSAARENQGARAGFGEAAVGDGAGEGRVIVIVYVELYVSSRQVQGRDGGVGVGVVGEFGGEIDEFEVLYRDDGGVPGFEVQLVVTEEGAAVDVLVCFAGCLNVYDIARTSLSTEDIPFYRSVTFDRDGVASDDTVGSSAENAPFHRSVAADLNAVTVCVRIICTNTRNIPRHLSVADVDLVSACRVFRAVALDISALNKADNRRFATDVYLVIFYGTVDRRVNTVFPDISAKPPVLQPPKMRTALAPSLAQAVFPLTMPPLEQPPQTLVVTAPFVRKTSLPETLALPLEYPPRT
ncbi:MAG: hypothetical protein EZS28_034657, partial [Streblomastix strix]